MQTSLASPYRTKQKRTLRWRRASSQRYPGQLYDSESGLHYNGFRDQETSTGRYIQPDPIGLEGGISAYGYVNSNPLMNIDPNGLTTTTLPYSGIPITDYGRPPARPMPMPRPGPAPGLGWGSGALMMCRNLVGAAAANPIAVFVIGALYPSSTYACNDYIAKPECPGYMTENEDEKRLKNCQALKDSILNTCYGLDPRKRMKCFEAANITFRQCMGYQ